MLRFGTELDDFGPGLNKAAGTETIRKLDLSARMLPDMSVVTGALVQLIQASKGLVELDIRDDNVTDDVAQQFADAVRKHSSLQVFSELPLQDLRDKLARDVRLPQIKVHNAAILTKKLLKELLRSLAKRVRP